MKGPEFESHEESVIEKINLQDGETAYFDGKRYQVGFDPEYGIYAKADTFIVGKNGPKLEAHGGPCAVVSLFETSSRIGALLHIDTAYIEDKPHLENLIDKLTTALQDIPQETTDVNVFVDVEDSEDLPEEARRWCQMIVEKLQGHFSHVGSFTRGEFKDVRLNTKTGKLRVFDIKHRLIFSK